VLLLEQLAEGRLLFLAAFQHQEHTLHRQASRRRAKIGFRTRQWMRVALQNYPVCLNHGLSGSSRDTVALSNGEIGQQSKREQEHKRCVQNSHRWKFELV
jgi:hypothetical protein